MTADMLVAKEEKISQFVYNIEQKLNKVAIAHRWDDIKSVRAGAGVPISEGMSEEEQAIHNEAVSLSLWERSVWAYCLKIEKAIAGKEEISQDELDDFIHGIPEYKSL